MITRTKHLGRAKKLLLIPILCVFVTACTAIQGNRGSDDTLQKKIQAFEERPQAVTIEVVRVHAEQDIALIRTMGWIPMPEPLPLYTEPQQLEEGQPVIMMGYPTGLDAIL